MLPDITRYARFCQPVTCHLQDQVSLFLCLLLSLSAFVCLLSLSSSLPPKSYVCLSVSVSLCLTFCVSVPPSMFRHCQQCQILPACHQSSVSIDCQPVTSVFVCFCFCPPPSISCLGWVVWIEIYKCSKQPKNCQFVCVSVCLPVSFPPHIRQVIVVLVSI